MNTQDFLYGAFIGVILGFIVFYLLDLFIKSFFKEVCDHKCTFESGNKKICLSCNKKIK